MPRFYGTQTVLATLNKQQRTGKVSSGTLKVRGNDDTFASVAWAHLYLWPTTEITGLGGGGYSHVAAKATLYRIGESYAPRVDDKLSAGGSEWQITRVQPRLNADEDDGFAVYDCDLE